MDFKKEIQHFEKRARKYKKDLEFTKKEILEMEEKIEETENPQILSRLRFLINRYKKIRKRIKNSIKFVEETLNVLKKEFK